MPLGLLSANEIENLNREGLITPALSKTELEQLMRDAQSLEKQLKKQ